MVVPVAILLPMVLRVLLVVTAAFHRPLPMDNTSPLLQELLARVVKVVPAAAAAAAAKEIMIITTVYLLTDTIA